MRNEDASLITALARRHGMRNLREDGWDKVRRGVTTAEEVLRVTQEF
jgi:type II secretory ATPase GspE/PulE/Tfp pilus assembly ATPase PilB-like protein